MQLEQRCEKGSQPQKNARACVVCMCARLCVCVAVCCLQPRYDKPEHIRTGQNFPERRQQLSTVAIFTVDVAIF